MSDQLDDSVAAHALNALPEDERDLVETAIVFDEELNSHYEAHRRIAAELDRGTADLLFIRGDSGFVVTTRAGADAVLVVTARLEAKLGLIFLDLNRAAKSIAEILV